MGKIIALIRTSTVVQEVETQKKEVISMILADGYREDEIIVIGKAGASAIKLDEEYIRNINKVYDLIETGEIEAVYAWAIDRIGRNEEVLMQFKNRLIRKGVQLVIKNPSLKLLNHDGSVNAGVELAFTLFSTMAKQEMEQKKQRFARARKRNLEQGKSIGGNAPLGYDFDKNNFIVVNNKEAELIRLIYSLFNSGNYSTSKLAKELNERGYKTKYGYDFTAVMVTTILKNKAYIGGYVDERGRKRNFPSIVSADEQDKAKSILSSNNVNQTKSTKHYPFGLKLVKCKNCGHNHQILNDTYHCTGNILSKRIGTTHLSDCNNTTSLSVNNLDGILWKLTKDFMADEIESEHTGMENEIREQLNVLNEKKQVIQKKLSLYDRKINEIVEHADRELKSEEYISRRISNVNKQREIDKKEYINIEDEIKRLEDNLNFTSTFQKMFTGYNSISDIEIKGDEKTLRDLVHRYINKITFEKTTYNGNPFYYKIDISTNKGTFVVYYNGRSRYLDKCFIRKPTGNEDEPFRFERMIRNENHITTDSNERFKSFRTEVEKMIGHVQSTMDIERQMNTSDGLLSELYRKVSSDNRKRVEQYLNDVSIRITQKGEWMKDGYKGVVSRIIIDETDRTSEEIKELEEMSFKGMERMVKKKIEG